MLHYYKFKDITKNPLLQENLLNKKSVFRVLSTISRDSTITRYTITSVDCSCLAPLYVLILEAKWTFEEKRQMYKSSTTKQ